MGPPSPVFGVATTTCGEELPPGSRLNGWLGVPMPRPSGLAVGALLGEVLSMKVRVTPEGAFVAGAVGADMGELDALSMRTRGRGGGGGG